MKKRNITLFTAFAAAAAFASSAQAATITMSEWNSDFTKLGGDVTTRIDQWTGLPNLLFIGATGGQQAFADFRFTSAAIGTLITGTASADTFVDAADFNANAEVTLQFTLTEDNTAVAATGTITIFNDTVAGVNGHVGLTMGATLGTTPFDPALGLQSVSLAADAGGYELGAMLTDQADWADPTIQASAYNMNTPQLVVTRAIPAPSSTLAIADIRHLGATVELDLEGLDSLKTYKLFRDTILPLGGGSKVQVGPDITGTTTTTATDTGPLPVDGYYQVEQQP